MIEEQKYAIVPCSMTSSIDWSKTYQTVDTARFSIDGSQFVISIPETSDYMPELEWKGADDVYQIVSTDEFSGPRPTLEERMVS